MKKVTKLALAATAALTLSTSLHAMDAAKECNVKANGIDKVLALAKVKNAEAIKRGLEFRRLGVNNSALITSIEEGMKAGAKEVNPKDFKGKTSKTKLEINYATQRACMFSIRALQQADEAKTAWRLAVPGDGFKY